MNPAISAFMELARRDAAVQEKCSVASKQSDPIAALVKLAASLGFAFTGAELRGVLDGELSEAQLGRISGGVPGGTAAPEIVGSTQVADFRAPGEWFAEAYLKSRSIT